MGPALANVVDNEVDGQKKEDHLHDHKASVKVKEGRRLISVQVLSVTDEADQHHQGGDCHCQYVDAISKDIHLISLVSPLPDWKNES